MAVPYDQLSAITQAKFIPKMYDNIFDSNPLLKRLKSKSYQKLDGGTDIRVPLNYAQTSASGWYSGTDVLDTTDNQNITAASYTWKQLYANVTILRSEELKNSGDSQIIALMKQKVQIAEKTLSDVMGTAAYNDGSDANAMGGLRLIVGTSNTVGTISQSGNSWWRGQVDTSTTTLSVAAVQTLFNLQSIDNDHPTVIMSTRANYDRYYALLQPQQRFVDSDAAKGGFLSLMFNGVPWLADSHCPASHIFVLNENYLHLFAHKDEDMRMSDWLSPVNQNLKTAKIYWMGALGSSNIRLQGKLSAVAA